MMFFKNKIKIKISESNMEYLKIMGFFYENRKPINKEFLNEYINELIKKDYTISLIKGIKPKRGLKL